KSGATMTSPRWRPAILSLAMVAGIATSGCRTTFVVVPAPASQYTARDTLYATQHGEELRVTFRFDTIMRVDTVMRVDTAWRRGARTVVRVDTVQRVDTVRVRTRAARVDTILRVDTVRLRDRTVRVDTVLRVDTVRVRDRTVRVDTVL